MAWYDSPALDARNATSLIKAMVGSARTSSFPSRVSLGMLSRSFCVLPEPGAAIAV